MDVDELRAELEELVVAPSVDRDALRRVRERASTRRRTSGAVTALAGALLVALLVGGVVGRSDDVDLRVGGVPTGTSIQRAPTTTAPAPTTTAPVTPTGLAAGSMAADAQLVPGTVPAGFVLVGRSGLGPGSPAMGQSGSASTDRTQRWIRFDAERRHGEAVLDVTWTVAGHRLEELGGAAGEPLTIRGRAGVAVEPDGIAWEEPAGRVVTISSSQLPTADLVTVADGLDLRPDGGFTVTTPPPGFELIAEWPGMMSTGSNLRSVTYQDGTRAFDVTIAEHSDHRPGIRLSQPANEVVSVRGHDGVLGPSTFESMSRVAVVTGVQPDLFLDWDEGDSLVTIVSVGLTPEEVLAIAEDLVPVPTSSLGG